MAPEFGDVAVRPHEANHPMVLVEHRKSPREHVDPAAVLVPQFQFGFIDVGRPRLQFLDHLVETLDRSGE
jgi:hypothetical protein